MVHKNRVVMTEVWDWLEKNGRQRMASLHKLGVPSAAESRCQPCLPRLRALPHLHS